MTRPYFDVVGVFLASAIVAMLALFGMGFLGVKLSLDGLLLSSISTPVVYFAGGAVWSLFLRQHKKALREYEAWKSGEKSARTT